MLSAECQALGTRLPVASIPAQAVREVEVQTSCRARLFHVREQQSSDVTGSDASIQVGIIKVTTQQIAELQGEVFELRPAATNAFIQRSAHLLALPWIQLQHAMQEQQVQGTDGLCER